MAEGDPLSDSRAEIPEVPEIADANTETDEELERIPLWMQLIWCAFGFAGFARAAYPRDNSFPLHPETSMSVLAWLVFFVAGLAINALDQVGIPGAKLSFRKRLKQVTEAADRSQTSVRALSEVIADYSDLLQSWTNSINLLSEHLERYGTSVERAYELLARFCLERMEEARALIGEAGDRFRFSLWWYVEDEDGLRILFSDDIRDEATLKHIFRPGSGLLGQCYIEDRIYNLRDAPSSIYYEKIRERPDYHGLLLVPVKARTQEGVIGVLSIDRRKKETFPAAAENVARGLADIMAYAIQTVFAFSPSRSEEPTP